MKLKANNKMRSYKQTFVLIVILLVTLLSTGAVFGEVGLGGGRTVLVNAHGICARVTNYNGPDFFIPTGNPTEWSYFRSYAPNKAVANINSTAFTLVGGGIFGGPSADVNIQCGPSGKIGLRVQPRAYNTCSWPLYTGTTFDYWPAYVVSSGCHIGTGTPWNRVPDFTFGTSGVYAWQTHSGNGCDAGCAYQYVYYDGNSTITFTTGALTPYGNTTITWDAAGNPSIYYPPVPEPPPCTGSQC